MKKNHLFLVCATALLLIFGTNSCSSDESKQVMSEPEINNPYETLNDQLSDFDQQFMSNHPMSRCIFCSIITFVQSDFWTVTTAEGNTKLIASIGASIEAISTKDLVYIIDNINSADAVELTTNFYNEYIAKDINYGYFHNTVIINLAKNNPTAFTSDRETLLAAIDQELRAVGVKTTAKDLSDAKTALTNFTDNILDETPEGTYNNLKLAYPQKAEQLNLMKKYFDNVIKLEKNEDMIAYTKGCQEIISNSKLEKAEKAEINGALSIAPASSKIWEGANKDSMKVSK